MDRGAFSRGFAAAVVALAAMVASSSPAAAGGSWFYPLEDRYEPGEVATVVGYTGGGQLGWVEDGPFFAYLRRSASDTSVAFLDPQPGDLDLGPLDLTETDQWGLRVGVTFEIPLDLEPGRYEFLYCNDPCTTGLGDLIGGSVFVGIDPPYEIQRDLLEDPALVEPPASAAATSSATSTTSATSPEIVEPEFETLANRAEADRHVSLAQVLGVVGAVLVIVGLFAGGRTAGRRLGLLSRVGEARRR